jgi:hypothetical protein
MDETNAIAPRVETKRIRLTHDKWTELGQGPVHIGAAGGEIYYSLADEEPIADVGFLLRFDDPAISVPTRSRTWGRACLSNVYASVVVAPLSGDAHDSLAGVSSPSARNSK